MGSGVQKLRRALNAILAAGRVGRERRPRCETSFTRATVQ